MKRAAKAALKDEEAAKIAKALSNPLRLRLLAAVSQREQGVEALAERLGLPLGNTSAQLQVLHRAGLVSARREGRRVFYQPADPCVARLLLAVHETAARTSAAFSALLAEHFGEVPPGDVRRLEALLDEVAEGRLRLLDVRDAADHAAGHLPGAESVPMSALEALGPEAFGLEPGRPVAVYCRGRFCIEAEDAARLLRARGFTVVNLFTGVAEAAALLGPRGGASGARDPGEGGVGEAAQVEPTAALLRAGDDVHGPA